MRSTAMLLAAAVLIGASLAGSASAQVTAQTLGFDPKASVSLGGGVTVHAFGECHFGVGASGAPIPDPRCTPGAINPTLTVKVLTDPRFRTGMVRDQITSEKAKELVYGWYGLKKPANNKGANQTAELDHLIDLGSGGGDSLDNVWPQAQRPTDPAVPVGQRWFKIKDANAEHQMIAALKAGETDAELLDQQKRIAADWTVLDKAAPSIP